MKRLLLPAIAAAFLMTGCSSLADLSGITTAAASRCTPHAMILIIGAHRNTPRPSLGPRLVCQLTATIRAGKLVRIVAATGQPRMVTFRLASVRGGTLAQQGSSRVQQDVQHVQQVIASLRPQSAGVDDLAALALAADMARAAGDPHAELVLLDSGLDDRGALSFTIPGMVAAVPAEVARQLQASGNLPDLGGFTTVLAGLGYTSPPQTPLSAKWRSNITQIWAAVVRTAGATAVIIPQPGQGPSVPTSQPVKPVPVPPTQSVKPSPHTTIVFNGESAVRFQPDSTAFADPAAAAKALTPIAGWLAADLSRQARLVGTTADVGPMPGQKALSRLRAERVGRELIALGASPTQITIMGVGSDFPQFVPDWDSSGTLLPGPATLNRSVRITLK